MTRISAAGLRTVVDHYEAVNRSKPLEELRYFATRSTDEEAVGEAAMCRINGKRLSHQRRLTRSALEEAGRRLVGNLSVLRAARTYEELHDDVEALIAVIPGIGDLTVYDIALRIGARFKKSPAVIYLHAGTRAGAKALDLDWRARTLQVDDLPPELRKLTAREAEDVLCIYKDSLASGDVSKLRASCAPRRGSSRC